MQKTITRLLIIIAAILIALLIYKAIKPIKGVSVPVNTTVVQQPELGADFKEKIQLIIKEYLIENPEVIIDAVENLQKRKIEEMENKVKNYIEEKKSEIESSKASPFIGNDQGDVIIAFFFDYNCGYCKKSNEYINKLIEADKGVKVVLRPFPILGETSTYAAKAALAVYRTTPDKFMIIHEGLMQMKVINKEAVEALLIANNLNLATIEEEIDKSEIKDILDSNYDLAKNLRIQGVPAYVINSKLLPGLLNLEQMQQIISEIRNSNNTKTSPAS